MTTTKEVISHAPAGSGGKAARDRNSRRLSAPSHGRFNEQVAPDTTVGRVRGDAMAHFGVADDPQYTYYLTHDADRLDDARTIGEIAGHARSLKVTLVKELLQG